MRFAIRRAFVFLFIAVAALAALVPGYIYFVSEHYLADVSADKSFIYSEEPGPEFVERGRHLVRTRGCFGCHGQTLEGRAFAEEWDWVDTAVAINLAQYAQTQDPATLEAAIRQGIGHDGRALWSMPSYNFALLNDSDTSAIIAYLRSAPVVEKDLPEPDIGWAARTRIVRSQAQHMADWADRMPPLLMGDQDAPELVRGEYLAKTTCNECHGFDLRGMSDQGPPVPDLAIVSAYTDGDFHRLMRSGEGIGGREALGLMTMVAKDRFAYFTDEELADLLAYLRTLPGQPVDRDAEWRSLQ